MSAFSPAAVGTQHAVANNASAAAALGTSTFFQVFNPLAETAHVRFGAADVAATAACFAVPGGKAVVVARDGATHVSVFSAGTGNVLITPVKKVG